MNDDADGLMSRQILDPLQEVFLRLRPEAPLAERCRLERIEELFNFAQPDLDVAARFLRLHPNRCVHIVSASISHPWPAVSPPTPLPVLLSSSPDARTTS